MAQRFEIEAWVNPSAWDDEAKGWAVVDAIEAAGTGDESEWVRIAGGDAGDVISAAERDTVTAEQVAALTESAEVRAQALASAAAATERLKEHVREAVAGGMFEHDAAQHAGVTRMTVRSWLGK